MSIEITIRVPEELGRELERFRDRLPELLERGLRDVQGVSISDDADAAAILAALASQPTPEQVLALRPSGAMQARVSELLLRSKVDGLSRTEESELDRYLYLEHLVRLARTHALNQNSPGE
jgi:hypothetical protein